MPPRQPPSSRISNRPHVEIPPFGRAQFSARRQKVRNAPGVLAHDPRNQIDLSQHGLNPKACLKIALKYLRLALVMHAPGQNLRPGVTAPRGFYDLPDDFLERVHVIIEQKYPPRTRDGFLLKNLNLTFACSVRRRYLRQSWPHG